MPHEAASGQPRSAPAVGPVRLADALGVTSSLLGAPMNLAPRRFLRAIGVEDDPKAVAWTQGVGVREHLATINVLAMRQRRIGMWSRVAGDLMDLSLLVAAHRHKRADAARLQRAMAAVGGILALDLFTAIQLTRADTEHRRDGAGSSGTGVQHEEPGGPLHVRTAVTIRGSEEEVRRRFREFEWSAFDPAELEAAGDVRFVPAPGGRGIEVHLDHEPSVRGGALGAAAAKVVGQAPDQAIHDELRRFKALLETGVIPRSEKSPEGASAGRQIKQRPAQPVGGSA
ncbi:MAG TPA: hypothetical protein VD931_00895 [Baekduia sp.]|nr:hypothetical protein [Baekduia sp.]